MMTKAKKTHEVGQMLREVNVLLGQPVVLLLAFCLLIK